MIIIVIVCAFLGSVLAGLFGGGASLILTPAIYFFLLHENPNASSVMQTSITTMITALMIPGILAIQKQHKYKQIHWRTVRWSAPLVLLGVVIGCMILKEVSSRMVVIFFSVATILLATKYLLNIIKIQEKRYDYSSNKALRILGSFTLGVISTISGSASFVMPYYEIMGLNMKQAIGTTTTIVWLYSIFILIFMISLGTGQENLPSGNIGYLNYRYLLPILLPSMLGMTLGARLSYILPERKLRIAFMLLLYVIGVSMLLS